MLNLTPFLHGYSWYRNRQLQKQDPVTSQRKVLHKLCAHASRTSFGRDHSFSSLRTVADYQSAVPIRKYEDFWQEYWKPAFPVLQDCTWPGLITYFPVSSGTTSGTTKYIPYTKEMSASNAKAGLDLLVHHVTQRPQSQLLGGLNFMLGGSTVFREEAPGVMSGDLSGISVKELPWWIKPRYFPDEELALLSDWDEKIHRLAEECLKRDIRTISGVPSWMLIFIDTLAQLKPELPRKLSSYFPNLELVIHGGVNFTPYHQQFTELLEGSNAELREVYPASEGFIGVADQGYGEGLRLLLDTDIFYEFIPVEELESPNPTRHWIGNVQKDINYAIVLTTCAGLWSYLIGDTVRFVSLAPPRVLITGRTSYTLSAFGEHLIAEEVEDAVHAALSEEEFSATDYSVGAIFPESKGELGGHRYVIELSEDSYQAYLEKTGVPSRMSAVIDSRLSQRNEDYEAHRAEGFGLRAPEVEIVPPGFFSRWMESRGKLGGQNKVPRLISRPELFSELLSFVAHSRQ
ncbi:GH3 auxin-responsive promoter family protein [bacterium]|nr:GH3 auxin-responsive promoter family protein [bacterium]